jgi:hypothetical protein
MTLFRYGSGGGDTTMCEHAWGQLGGGGSLIDVLVFYRLAFWGGLVSLYAKQY